MAHRRFAGDLAQAVIGPAGARLERALGGDDKAQPVEERHRPLRGPEPFYEELRRAHARAAGIPDAVTVAAVERRDVPIPSPFSPFVLEVDDPETIATRFNGLVTGAVRWIAGPLVDHHLAPGLALVSAPSRASVARHPTAEEASRLEVAVSVSDDEVEPCGDEAGIARRVAALAKGLAGLTTPRPPAFGDPALDARPAFEAGVLAFAVRALALPDARALEVLSTIPGWALAGDDFTAMSSAIRSSGLWEADALGILLDGAELEHVAAVAEAEARAKAAAAKLSVPVRASLAEHRIWLWSGNVRPHFLTLESGRFAAQPDLIIDGQPAFGHPAIADVPSPGIDGFLPASLEVELEPAKLAAIRARTPDPLYVEEALAAVHRAGLVDHRPLAWSEVHGWESASESALTHACKPRAARFGDEMYTESAWRRQIALATAASELCRGDLRHPAIAASLLTEALKRKIARIAGPPSEWEGPFAYPTIPDVPKNERDTTIWWLMGYAQTIETACKGAFEGDPKWCLHSPGATLDALAAAVEDVEENEARAEADANESDPWRAILLRAVNGKPVTSAEVRAALERAGERAPDVPEVRKRIFRLMADLGYSKSMVRIDGSRRNAFVRRKEIST